MKSPRTGVFAALGGCVCTGIASPLVSFLKVYRTEEMLLVRGLFAVIGALVLLHLRPRLPGWRLLASALLLGGATWTYYQAMRAWGVDLTMVVLTTSPLGNFLIQRVVHKKRVRRSARWALLGVVAGAVLALQPWHGDMNWAGFAWSLGSVAFTGAGFDLLSTSEGGPVDRVFWYGLVYALGGAALCVANGRPPFAGTDIVGRDAFLLAIFATAGALTYVCNIYTFDNLRIEVASVLNASQVMAAIIGAWFLMGEYLSYDRLAGAALSFGSATWLSYVSSRPAKPRPASS